MNTPVITPEKLIWKDSPSQLKDLGFFIVCGIFSFLIIPFGMFIYKWLQNEKIIYTLTSQRLLISHGLGNKLTEQVELYRVRDYVLSQPIGLRLFGLSNIIITTIDEGNPHINIFAVRWGSHVVDHIRNSVEQVRSEKQVRSVDVSHF